MGKLENKVCIVTGASRGIGAEIARLFAAEGGKVVCAARTLKEGEHVLQGSLETTVTGIREAGGEASAVVCNIAEYENCKELVDEARRLYGPIDVLVNNAALTYTHPVAEYPPHRWLRAFAVSFNAPFFLSQLVLPDMIARKAGAIVNVSSGAAIGPGRGPYPPNMAGGLTLYGAEKAALERFTQGLASEVYGNGVSVTCYSPSDVVLTPGVRMLLPETVRRATADPSLAESEETMAKAALLLATEPLERVSGRVTYSQQILKEFGWIENAHGTGVDSPGSGYSQI